MKAQIREVKSQLSHYGDLAHSGKRITVTKNGADWFELVPIAQKPRRTQPLKQVKPTISKAVAVSPVAEEDIKGWI